jgi:hypothetical protein
MPNLLQPANMLPEVSADNPSQSFYLLTTYHSSRHKLAQSRLCLECIHHSWTIVEILTNWRSRRCQAQSIGSGKQMRLQMYVTGPNRLFGAWKILALVEYTHRCCSDLHNILLHLYPACSLRTWILTMIPPRPETHGQLTGMVHRLF